MRNKTLINLAQAKQISVYFLVCLVVVVMPAASIAKFTNQFLVSQAVPVNTVSPKGLSR